MTRLSDCKCQEITKQDIKICTIRDNGAMRITAGAINALTCLPTLNLVVRLGRFSCTSTLMSGLLVLLSGQSRAQQYIIAVSEVGSHI
jgi:hypothetical protein